jgi:hypothetical protein
MYAFTFAWSARRRSAVVAQKNILIIITYAIFLVFFSNVAAGAAGFSVFLSDVGEMLTLFAACVCFVVAILSHERSGESRTGSAGE